MIYYSRIGRLDIVNKLLRPTVPSEARPSFSEININIQNRYNNTALIYASRHGYNNIVQKLLEYKADCNIQGEEKYTALIWASRNVRVDIVELLIKYKAYYFLQDIQNMTALMWAYNIKCSQCIFKKQKIIKMLKGYECDQIRRSLTSDCLLYICEDVVELIITFIL